MNDLRFDRVCVGRKGRVFHQDFEARFGRAIKRRHHQVNIHSKAVHADNFVGLGASEPRRRLAQRFVVRIPRRACGMVSIDPKLCPIVQFLFEDCARSFRHQPERIAGEIDEWLAVFAQRQMKFFPKRAERILRIELQREIFVSTKIHGLTFKPAAWANFLWRLSNERKVFASHSRAAATCKRSIVRCPVCDACLSLSSSARRKTLVHSIGV